MDIQQSEQLIPNGCIFCKMREGEIETGFIFEDEEIMVFNDIKPSSPVHVLIVPKKHIISVKDLEDKDALLVGRLVLKARDIGRENGLDGYKLAINVGRSAGQMVDHLHLHLLGDK